VPARAKTQLALNPVSNPKEDAMPRYLLYLALFSVLALTRTTFDIFGGFTFDRDAFGAYTIPNPTPPPVLTTIAAITQNSGEGLVGEELDSKISKRTTVTERFSFFPNITHLGDYRMQFDSRVASQVKNWLSWHVTFTDRDITYPPPGLKGNDLLLSTGLRVTWGRVKL
jgi:hypothetical protein